jgi:predicted ATPase
MKLTQLTLQGYTSIDEQGQTIELGDITVLLGANSAGKSNLISFFRMLHSMTSGALQNYIGEQGYAESILHFGCQHTSRIRAELVFIDDQDTRDTYEFVLSHASGDILIFTKELITHKNSQHPEPVKIQLGSGHKESLLQDEAVREGRTDRSIYAMLEGCRVFQFHDTSGTAKIRNQGYIGDTAHLRSNGGNLAAFLYMLQNKAEWKKYYERIIRHIQLIFPQFNDFILNPSPLNPEYIKLDWQEKNSDYRFGSHQLSDGLLRFMALTTLLLQPEKLLPGLIILDEPELGLHPAALSTLSGMVRRAGKHSQVLMATQSPRLVDEFYATEIIVVERDRARNSSIFSRLNNNKLGQWLERYSLSELWEKNILGGRPS